MEGNLPKDLAQINSKFKINCADITKDKIVTVRSVKDGQCPIILEDIADAVNQTGKGRKVKLNGEYPDKLGNPTNVKLGNGLILIGSS